MYDNDLNDYIELSLLNSDINFDKKTKRKKRTEKTHKIINGMIRVLDIGLLILTPIIKFLILFFVIVFTLMFALVKE